MNDTSINMHLKKYAFVTSKTCRAVVILLNVSQNHSLALKLTSSVKWESIHGYSQAMADI